MRGFNRIASALLGVVLLAGGLLVALEAALVGAYRRPVWLPLGRWYRSLVNTEVSNRTVLYVALGVGILGLIVLFLQLRPWVPDRLLVGAHPGPATGDSTPAMAALAAPTGEARAREAGAPPAPAPAAPAAAGNGQAPWWVSRRSVQRRTASAACTVSGVTHGRATVRGRPDRWRLRVRADGPADRYDAVGAAVRAELDRLSAPAGTAVDLSLRSPRGRVV